MSVIAAILLLISSFTHAGWNFLSKKAHPSIAFFFVANTTGIICPLVILPLYLNKIELVPLTVWIFVVISGFFLATYMAALSGSYRTGDMSIAYPLARSLPVIFVFIITFFLGNGNPLGVWCIIGILIVVFGCLSLPMKAFDEFHISRYKNLSCFLAVLAAVGITGYTVTDDTALRYLRELPGNQFRPIDATLVYLLLEGSACSLWLGIFLLFDPRERKGFYDVVHYLKGSAAITGIGIYLTYGMVLAAMNYVTNVSYIAAFRQLSIPIGAMLGMVLLKEPRHFPKLVGVTIIFVGLGFVGVG